MKQHINKFINDGISVIICKDNLTHNTWIDVSDFARFIGFRKKTAVHDWDGKNKVFTHNEIMRRGNFDFRQTSCNDEMKTYTSPDAILYDPRERYASEIRSSRKYFAYSTISRIIYHIAKVYCMNLWRKTHPGHNIISYAQIFAPDKVDVLQQALSCIDEVRYIYIMTSSMHENVNEYKIGRTGDLDDRLKCFRCAYPPFYFKHVFEINKYSNMEDKLHKKLSKYTIGGEWFQVPFDIIINTIDKIKKAS
jgi:hypothetical protein